MINLAEHLEVDGPLSDRENQIVRVLLGVYIAALMAPVLMNSTLNPEVPELTSGQLRVYQAKCFRQAQEFGATMFPDLRIRLKSSTTDLI